MSAVEEWWVYTPCRDCYTGRHMIRRTTQPGVVSVINIHGQHTNVSIATETAYLRVGDTCYIPTLSGADTTPLGHNKTLSELWDEHGLMSLEWALPYERV